MSDLWGFHTQWDGDSKVLFEDDFSSDKGWTLTGKSDGGAWERGNPVPTEYGGAPAQPGDCFGGNDCMFTAQNQDADVEADDVDGGTVAITSPPFDPTGSKSVTVSFARWFYRSDYDQTGAEFKVELLVPDDTAEGGEVAHVLEKLDNDAAAQSAAVWTPVAYSACDVPYVPGTRLRVSATNPEGLPDEVVDVVEAALDNVVVSASRGLSDRECAALVPGYNLRDADTAPDPGHHGAVEGFDVQRSAARATISRALSATAARHAQSRVPGSSVRNLRVAVVPRRLTTSRLGFPAYVLAYRYGDTVYRAIVHGQNPGIVHGSAPLSWLRIVMVVAGAIAAIGVVAVIVWLATTTAIR
jgi:hypothetical protein